MNNPRPVGQFFDSYAQDFDSIYGGKRGVIGRQLDQLFRKSMLLRYQKSLQTCTPTEGCTILDVGCGPGHYCVALAQLGAAKVVGIDVAPEMLNIAEKHAVDAGVMQRCEFIAVDFEKYQPTAPFDYAVIMGVMDYVPEPGQFISHVLSMTRRRACFSFPADNGILAAIRRYRYRNRTPLYMYNSADLTKLFDEVAKGQYTIERLKRDFFVQVEK